MVSLVKEYKAVLVNSEFFNQILHYFLFNIFDFVTFIHPCIYSMSIAVTYSTLLTILRKYHNI